MASRRHAQVHEPEGRRVLDPRVIVLPVHALQRVRSHAPRVCDREIEGGQGHEAVNVGLIGRMLKRGTRGPHHPAALEVGDLQGHGAGAQRCERAVARTSGAAGGCGAGPCAAAVPRTRRRAAVLRGPHRPRPAPVARGYVRANSSIGGCTRPSCPSAGVGDHPRGRRGSGNPRSTDLRSCSASWSRCHRRSCRCRRRR